VAITSGQTSVGTSPTLIDGLEVNPFRLHLHNNDVTDEVFLGGSAVTTTTGLKLLKQDSIELIINPLEALYAVSSKTGHVVSWLKQTE
jgi:hypothetical protein